MSIEKSSIGFQTLSVGAVEVKPQIPIGSKLGFLEVEGDVRYSINNQDVNLTDSTGGALLMAGTKIDIQESDLYSLRLISADGTNQTVHLTYYD